MIRKSLHLIIGFFLISNWILAQDSTKIKWEEFYPLHPGDFWKYKIEWVETGRIEFETKEVIAETTSSNDRIFKKIAHYYHGIRLYNYERVDSLGDVYTYYPAPDKEVLVWRLNISIGEGWWTVDSTSFLKLTDKGLMNPWGDSVIYLVFKQYSFLGGIFWDSSYVGIVQNFGVASRSPGGCSGASEELIGAVIKGKVYGDTSTLGIGDRKKEKLRPKCFILYQNYPNPFNSSTTISFTLSNSENIEISSINCKGQKVESIYNGYMTAGFHSLNYNAHFIPSGVYFIKLIMNDSVQSQKCLFLR